MLISSSHSILATTKANAWHTNFAKRLWLFLTIISKAIKHLVTELHTQHVRYTVCTITAMVGLVLTSFDTMPDTVTL